MKHLCTLFLILVIPLTFWAQDPLNSQVEDDLGEVDDQFQEFFFEALKQKGIENYDKAIDALQQCLNLEPNLPEVYFELGKNYKLLNKYLEAEQALLRALELKPKEEWVLDELYDVYVQQGETDKAMEVVQQLVDIHPDYKQDLATLYLKQNNYEKALKLLEELDRQYGPDEVRDAMRNEIYNSTGNDEARIQNLEQRIVSNPQNEENYLNLIYYYSEMGNESEAYRVTQQLIQAIPESELVHLALYKFYLKDGKIDEAIDSMKIALESAKVDPKTKTMILNDLLKVAKEYPKYQKDLLQITNNISEKGGGETKLEMGYYYLRNGNKEEALENLSEALALDPNNYDLIRNVLLLRIEFEQYETAASLSNSALDLYPAQPILYLLNGVANNRLNKSDLAIERLETGLDFIVDDIKMEMDFYKELSLAYRAMNNIKKSEAFASKVNELRQQQN